MTTALDKALDSMVSHIESVNAAREDLDVQMLIKAFEGAAFANFDEDDIGSELADIASNVAFDSRAFALSGTGGIKQANKSRSDIQAARDRLVTMMQDLRKAKSKTAKVLRTATVFLREKDLISGSTAKQADDFCAVTLREIAYRHETIESLISQVKDTLVLIDSKSRSLDSWFTLHKQYVFITGNRGPRGEQETFDRASQGRGLGKHRDSSGEEDDEDYDDEE